MGHFTIDLLDNQQADVNWGTLRKKTTFLNLFKSKKSGTVIKKGYVVKVKSTAGEQKEYRLLKTKEGKWTSEDDEGFHVTSDDAFSAAIKKAIDNYESQH